MTTPVRPTTARASARRSSGFTRRKARSRRSRTSCSKSWPAWRAPPAPRLCLTAVQSRDVADPATLIGRGKAEQLARACDRGGRLSRHRRKRAHAGAGAKPRKDPRPPCHRSDGAHSRYFARRARTREGQLQVELAQLRVSAPAARRLERRRSRGSAAASARGVRVKRNSKPIAGASASASPASSARSPTCSRRREYLRARRHRLDVPTVALVGYTNAGKTTLFNHLTGAHAVASDALFVTLDPLMRRMRLPDARQIVAGRHRRLHRSAAAPAGGGVSRHARRGEPRRPAAARHRCLGARPRTARTRPSVPSRPTSVPSRCR